MSPAAPSAVSHLRSSHPAAQSRCSQRLRSRPRARCPAERPALILARSDAHLSRGGRARIAADPQPLAGHRTVLMEIADCRRRQRQSRRRGRSHRARSQRALVAPAPSAALAAGAAAAATTVTRQVAETAREEHAGQENSWRRRVRRRRPSVRRRRGQEVLALDELVALRRRRRWRRAQCASSRTEAKACGKCSEAKVRRAGRRRAHGYAVRIGLRRRLRWPSQSSSVRLLRGAAVGTDSAAHQDGARGPWTPAETRGRGRTPAFAAARERASPTQPAFPPSCGRRAGRASRAQGHGRSCHRQPREKFKTCPPGWIPTDLEAMKAPPADCPHFPRKAVGITPFVEPPAGGAWSWTEALLLLSNNEAARRAP